jgi:hypothetical protein
MEKTFMLRYTEDEYWSLYEPKFAKKSNIFTHVSTFPWMIITISFLVISLMFAFVYSKGNNFNHLVICVATFLIALIFLANTLKKSQELMITLKQIRTNYAEIKNGVEITVNRTNIIFSYESKTELIQWVQVKDVIIEENYIQFYFYSKTPILIPKGIQTQQVMNQFEQEIASFI